MSLLTFIFRPLDFFCDMIFLPKMAKLWLGVSAKVWVLVSCLHPKDVISKAYPNYTKADKAEGLVVASEGPKPICHEEKVVVVFHHPPKHQQTQEFDCWVLHCLFMSQKKATNQDCSLSLTVQVRIILRKHKGHNETPTTQSSQKIHEKIKKMFLLRLCS